MNPAARNNQCANANNNHGWPGREHGRGFGAAAKPKSLTSQVHRLRRAIPARPALRTQFAGGNSARAHPINCPPIWPAPDIPLGFSSSSPAADATGCRMRARSMKSPLEVGRSDNATTDGGRGGLGRAPGGSGNDGFVVAKFSAKGAMGVAMTSND